MDKSSIEQNRDCLSCPLEFDSTRSITRIHSPRPCYRILSFARHLPFVYELSDLHIVPEPYPFYASGLFRFTKGDGRGGRKKSRNINESITVEQDILFGRILALRASYFLHEDPDARSVPNSLSNPRLDNGSMQVSGRKRRLRRLPR